MKTQAVRGAITVDKNLYEEIEKETVFLLREMLEENNINVEDISHTIFTMTKDLNAGYPAKAARINLDFANVPMMCFQELDIEGSLQKCIRVLMVVNTEKEKNEINHIYLKGAEILRPDLSK